MKKPVMFCMRMSSTMRDALRVAAEKDHRSVTSLLHKIIADYLEDAGLQLTENGAAERRRFPRKRVFLPAKTQLHPEEEIDAAPGLILDLSEGGVLLAFQKGSKVKITSIRERSGFEVAFQLPHTQEELRFNCNTRRMYDYESEIQVGAAFENPEDSHLQKLKNYLM
jgi:hypothetical protein